MDKKNILTIIPARAGSKRIKNKNIRKFLGKPLIAYTIEQARACSFIGRVMVDTDSLKVAKIARKFGAEVPWLRPKKLAQDKSKIVDSVLYNLHRFKEKENYQPDYVMILQTTSPLREQKDIENCWRMMQKTKATTILTVCPTHPRLYYLDKLQNIILANGSEKKSTNIQAWRAGYILNGCFVYIIKTSALLKEKSIITKNTKALICDKWRSVDLDESADWILAEYLYKNREKIAKRIKQLYGKK
ncbi:MAG: acylneuraminate cytidylyltransferase family protein [Candidatus Falkowbacteria bacterium]